MSHFKWVTYDEPRVMSHAWWVTYGWQMWSVIFGTMSAAACGVLMGTLLGQTWLARACALVRFILRYFLIIISVFIHLFLIVFIWIYVWALYEDRLGLLGRANSYAIFHVVLFFIFCIAKIHALAFTIWSLFLLLRSLNVYATVSEWITSWNSHVFPVDGGFCHAVHKLFLWTLHFKSIHLHHVNITLYVVFIA